MLDRARTRPDVEWILGDLTAVRFDREFDLVVMTGHAFQVFLTDDQLRAALAAIRSALIDGGRFAFETRNPLARAWERWTADNVVELVTPAGDVVRFTRADYAQVAGDLVSFSQTFTSPSWERPKASRSTLRFLDVDTLSAFLSGAGLVIAEQFGDWDRGPLADTSPEIITIAQRA
jgi:hypothetical protein